MVAENKKLGKALQKELLAVEKQEKKLQKAFVKAKRPAWQETLGEKIPAKVYTGLESTFCKGFAGLSICTEYLYHDDLEIGQRRYKIFISLCITQ